MKSHTTTLFLLLALICITKVQADPWAVLVAGSSGYMNYRHQADICHMYQILAENGYPDTHIVVMMYNDIANNVDNPYPGILMNDVDTRNVYHNIPQDYIGQNVTPDNFLNILKGNKTLQTPKVLETTSNDDIFVYFADHGAPGLLCFPNNNVLYAHDLLATFEYMFVNKKYNTLVMYVEACESGSMFSGLLNSSMSIYIVTAASPTQSSWGCCFDSKVGAYLGDVFSVNMLENSDGYDNVVTQTLQQQYEIIKSKTNTSHVCQYGDLRVAQNNVSRYMTFPITFLPPKCRPRLSVPVCRNHKNFVRATEFKVVEQTLLHTLSDTTNTSAILSRLYTNRAKDLQVYKAIQNTLTSSKAFRKYYLPQDPCNPTAPIDSRCVQRKLAPFLHQTGFELEYVAPYVSLLASECIPN